MAASPIPIHPSPPSSQAGRTIRITDVSDGTLLNRTYGYWSQAWVSGDWVYVFVGHADERPRFFRVTLSSGEVSRLGPLLSYTGTGEGWTWDADGWIWLHQGPRLRRVNPFTAEDHLIFDISGHFPGCRLHQGHTSDDGQTHSATIERITESGPYEKLGTIIWRHGQIDYYAARGALDESQVSRNGDYVLVKETREVSEDNRIITVATGQERWITDTEGALGHSDMGPDFAVGEDNHAGACVLFNLVNTLSRRVLFPTWAMGTLSLRNGRCLRSDATEISLIPLDGSPVTWSVAHGMSGNPNDYDYQVHANLDHSGRVAVFLSNGGTGRLDAYLIELPS